MQLLPDAAAAVGKVESYAGDPAKPPVATTEAVLAEDQAGPSSKEAEAAEDSDADDASDGSGQEGEEGEAGASFQFKLQCDSWTALRYESKNTVTDVSFCVLTSVPRLQQEHWLLGEPPEVQSRSHRQ